MHAFEPDPSSSVEHEEAPSTSFSEEALPPLLDRKYPPHPMDFLPVGAVPYYWNFRQSVNPEGVPFCTTCWQGRYFDRYDAFSTLNGTGIGDRNSISLLAEKRSGISYSRFAPAAIMVLANQDSTVTVHIDQPKLERLYPEKFGGIIEYINHDLALYYLRTRREEGDRLKTFTPISQSEHLAQRIGQKIKECLESLSRYT